MPSGMGDGVCPDASESLTKKSPDAVSGRSGISGATLAGDAAFAKPDKHTKKSATRVAAKAA